MLFCQSSANLGVSSSSFLFFDIKTSIAEYSQFGIADLDFSWANLALSELFYPLQDPSRQRLLSIAQTIGPISYEGIRTKNPNMDRLDAWQNK